MRLKLGIVLTALVAAWAGAAWSADKGGAPVVAAVEQSTGGRLVCQVGAGVGATLGFTDTGSWFDGSVGGHSTRPDFGLRAGCDIIRVGGSMFVLGLFGEYDWRNVAFTTDGGFALTDSYMFGGRAGIMIGHHTLPYLLLGWKHSDADWAAGVHGPSSFSGMTFGGGVEYVLPKYPQLSVALETQYTRYDSGTVTECGGECRGSVRPNDLGVMLRVNYNFGAGDAVRSAAAPLK